MLSMSEEMLLQLLYTISYYPDALSWNLLTKLINFFDSIQSLKTKEGIQKYIETLANFNAAYNIVGLNSNYITFFQKKLLSLLASYIPINPNSY